MVRSDEMRCDQDGKSSVGRHLILPECVLSMKKKNEKKKKINNRSTLGSAYDHALCESEQRRRDQQLVLKGEIHSRLSKGERSSTIDSAEPRPGDVQAKED